MGNFKNYIAVILAMVLGAVVPLSAVASAATASTTYNKPVLPDVYITEVQTATNNSGGEEFVELYNNTANDIDLADTAHAGKDSWKLQYFAGSKVASLLGTVNWTTPYRTINLTGSIPAHDYYVLAGSGYNPGNITPDQVYSSTLADDGGALQLIDSATTGTVTTVGIHSQLAWSTDKTLKANPVLFLAPGPGLSLQRIPNSDSQYINSDGSLTTFVADPRISPANAWTPPSAPPATVPSSGGDNPATGTTTILPATNAGLPTPYLTELLPNPASPQTDEADEFIELYNPGDSSFDLTGYALETGTTTLHDFTFMSGATLLPHSYRAFYSAETGLSLSNSGGQARLLDRKGVTISQSDAYSTAADGQSWVYDMATGKWQWSLMPTPNNENIVDIPAETASVIKNTSKKSPTSVTKVKGVSSTKKAKVVKAKEKATSKKKTKKPTTDAKLASVTAMPAAPIHPVVLAAVGLLAVGYGVYEYRQDIANRFYQFRTNRAARRKARR